MTEGPDLLPFPELEDLRRPLAEGLGRALRASCPAELAEGRAREAAERVIDGEGLPPEVADLFGGAPVMTLVCFDADRIHAWVFDSERVQVSAGASSTLDKLNRSVDEMVGEIPAIHGKLYSAGGGGMFFADTTTGAEDLAGRVRAWLEDPEENRSKGLTFTVVAEPLRAEDLAAEGADREGGRAPILGRFHVARGLRNALARLQAALRAAKDSTLRAAPPPVRRPPGEVRAERCPSCGRRPPSREGAPDDHRPERWCPHCQNLRDDRSFLDERRQPITFADLAARVRRPRQYLGYLAVDGNSMGAVLQSVGSFLQLRAFSEVTTIVYESARRRVPALLAPYLGNGTEPGECYFSLLSGGDEITLVLPAAAAPAVTLEVLRTIEAGFDEATREGGLLDRTFRADPPVLDRLRAAGAAAGVITAHANYPVRLLRRYAGELQKGAKRHCAARGHRSAVAWLLLTDSSPLTEGLERAAEVDFGLDAFARLLAEARSARDCGLPASTLQNLLSYYRREERALECLAGEGRRRVLDLLVANFFRYQLARLPKLAAWWEAIRGDAEAAAPPAEADGRDAVARWFEGGGGRRLEQLVDLLSLEPFAAEEEA